MKTQSIPVFQRTTSIVWVLLLLAVVTTAHATTHVIQFGGSIGLAYSPNSLSVSVGDTIKWEGDFSMHPLSSTGVPAAAATFHQGSGSVFTYPVTVVGTYNYQCDVHFSLGMIGSFTASQATGIENDRTSLRPDAFSLEQNYPNPFNPATTISFSLPSKSFVSMKVFNVIGIEVATVVSEELPAGNYTMQWHADGLSSGVYFYRLQAGSFSETKKLILLK